MLSSRTIRIAASLAVAHASATGAPAAAAQARSSEAVLQAAHDEWLGAYAAGNSARIAMLAASDFSLVESNGDRHDLAGLRARLAGPAVNLQLTAQERQIDRHGDIAVVKSTVLEQRGPAQLRFQVTDVLARQKGRWRVSRSHWTRIPEQPREILLGRDRLGQMGGHYRTPRGALLTVEVRGNRLMIREPSGQVTEFVLTADDLAVAPRSKVRWLFISGPDGRVTHAVIANQLTLTSLTKESK